MLVHGQVQLSLAENPTTRRNSMRLLSERKCGHIAKFLTLFSVFAWMVGLYLSAGDTPGILRKPSPPQIKTVPVNVNNSQNRDQHLGVTGTRSLAKSSQRKRITILKEFCRKKHGSFLGDFRKYLKQLIVIDSTKTLYCYIPKTGCTTTKLIMYNLQHGTNERNADHKQNWIHQQKLRTLNSYSKKDVDMRLATYTKLIVVRDPLERLASAWLDKFVYSPPAQRFSYIRKLQQKTLTTSNLTKTTNTSGSWNMRGSVGTTSSNLSPVTFRDFIWSIINKNYENIHWRPFFKLCGPCQIEYDVIAHTDTLAEDLRLFFHKSGIVGKDYILPRQHLTRSNETSFGNTFSEVPTEDIRRIGEIYKQDFDMFGYSFDDDLALIELERRDLSKKNV